jgi:glutamate formiminotransferase/formiminotetrahydrofolate cyclodeaminase
MDETAAYARRLAERIAKEAVIPVYCYEYAAFRSNGKSWPFAAKASTRGLNPVLVFRADPDLEVKVDGQVAQTGCTAVGPATF